MTIPKGLRERHGIRVGERIVLREEGEKIVIEVPKKIPDPSEYLWNLSKKPINVDAVKLVEESWERQ
ncbi:MAG: AbrB/MazE/SpoVT family DNA-binding domain-containing protein [Candidatus Verstraetearchaeota archaeon]|nr:AbrB/MazE/SpoVT family DNA-binding domain-containing protein [Candidatus Verstraetearchaeota archaeon]